MNGMRTIFCLVAVMACIGCDDRSDELHIQPDDGNEKLSKEYEGTRIRGGIDAQSKPD
jgi:hypothetical protein